MDDFGHLRGVCGDWLTFREASSGCEWNCRFSCLLAKTPNSTDHLITIAHVQVCYILHNEKRVIWKTRVPTDWKTYKPHPRHLQTSVKTRCLLQWCHKKYVSISLKSYRNITKAKEFSSSLGLIPLSALESADSSPLCAGCCWPFSSILSHSAHRHWSNVNVWTVVL